MYNKSSASQKSTWRQHAKLIPIIFLRGRVSQKSCNQSLADNPSNFRGKRFSMLIDWGNLPETEQLLPLDAECRNNCTRRAGNLHVENGKVAIGRHSMCRISSSLASFCNSAVFVAMDLRFWFLLERKSLESDTKHVIQQFNLYSWPLPVCEFVCGCD